MLTLKPNNRVEKSFKKFVLKEYWLANELSQMAQILKQQTNLNSLSIFLSEQQTVPYIFKFLILIHRIITQETPHSQILLSIIGKLKWFSCGDFEKMMSEKLIRPYQLYLQKRILFQYYKLAQKNPEESSINTFKLINLLHAGTSFVNFIYTLGRYYRREWISQFNIGLCIDLKAIYQALTSSMTTSPSKQLLMEIQALHQRLYLAFYNCYYHKYLKPYVPKWIKTDLGVTTIIKVSKRSSPTTKRSQSLSSKNKSTIQSEKNIHMNSSSLNLEASSCFLFNITPQKSFIDKIEIDDNLFQEENEERLNTNQKRSELIKDMEKIVDMISQ